MRLADYAMNYARLFPFLAVCILSGCVSGAQQQKGSWPWEYNRQEGRYPTGDYVAVSGPVANFGDAPKAVKPVTPESLAPPAPAAASPAGAASAKTPPPPASPARKPGPGAVTGQAQRGYDFTVAETKILSPSYVPTGSVREAYDIVACNRGNAPVSVTIGGGTASENMATDKPLPVTAVVPPHTDQVLVRVSARMKNKAYRFGYTTSWSIGDHRARHQCPEHYRFPFGEKVRAFASVGDPAGSTSYTRYAVVFSLPAGTPVLAARKGAVVRIDPSDDKIDILHDDGTIASYSHLGGIGAGVAAGKAVAAGEAIGTAGAADNREVVFFQLTVWRPEPRPSASPLANGPNPGYDLVSFPLEFCTTDTGGCRVLTQSQWVARNGAADVKKQGKRGTRPAVRKGGGS
ncbi:peptidoglycan DD-metalloendopeptidase family protein [Geobacter sp. AOG2]|uniref:peptidoglycan DD-metalloendopeptidase family protein n=1 Tax=Geobacter sp. AOG2 TaxID=1566347 RepID=UPI001CC7A371|nr:peptidoglycan DD-metalloendopeptidase family protein [Geobacter sp. AOG2]GFE62815.1 hypothetical protein AOG2_34040 [Geobacter sp. AOG2]